jgi:DNA-binding response OmpR family regulator
MRATLLIIDDSLTYRETLKAMLEEASYAVLAAANGTDGLRLAETAGLAAIIVDGVLPDLDGVEVIRRIRANHKIPCLLLTGLDDADTEEKAREAGADLFIRKDEELERIVARLRDLIAQ